MRTADCSTCRFFDLGRTLDGDEQEYGLCRRQAPIPAMRSSITLPDSEDVNISALWPEVWEHDWCGEWAILRPNEVRS